MSKRLLTANVATPFLPLVAPKSRSSFVANIRYIVYDCSSSIGQRCAGSIFAIPNIGHHSAIVPLLALYRRSFCHLFIERYHDTNIEVFPHFFFCLKCDIILLFHFYIGFLSVSNCLRFIVYGLTELLKSHLGGSFFLV